jgi:hypothetical protein
MTTDTRRDLPAALAAFLGAPAVWALHLFVSYALVALACSTGWDGIRVALAAVTIVFAAAAAWSGVLAWRAWRRAGAEGLADAADPAPGWRGLTMLAGIVLAAIFTLVIIFAGLPPLFVPVCG